MKKHVQYEVCYEIVSSIEYLREEEPGEHYFTMKRNWEGALWDLDVYEVVAYVEDGIVVNVEATSGSIHPEEEIVIRELMAKIIK